MTPDTHSIVVSSIWFTAAAWVYFRGVVTSDRDLKQSRQPGFQITDETLERRKQTGPISWWSERVLLLTAIASSATWLSAWLGGTPIHAAIALISIGTFLEPLAIPSATTPEPEDTRKFGTFVVKWFFTRIDVAFKTAISLAVFALLAKIPGISAVAEALSDWIFPVVHNRPASEFVTELMEGGAATMLIVFLIHLSQVMQYGLVFASVFAISLGFAWVQLQWFINEVFVLNGTTLILLGKSLLYTLSLKFGADFALLRLEGVRKPARRVVALD